MTDLPTHYNNKYVNFYSLWPCLSHSLVESRSVHTCISVSSSAIFVMAGYFEDDDDFSLSRLTQQGHKLDVMVISSDEDDNYGGSLQCVR